VVFLPRSLADAGWTITAVICAGEAAERDMPAAEL
jgi:hypothetical protein